MRTGPGHGIWVPGASLRLAGAERTARAAQQQVRDQATAEQAHWLRQRRFEAYEGSMRAYDSFARTATESLRAAGTASARRSSRPAAALRLAEARARCGARAFVHEFTWPSPAIQGSLGACHALDVPFVFDNLTDPSFAPLLGAPRRSRSPTACTPRGSPSPPSAIPAGPNTVNRAAPCTTSAPHRR